VEQTPLRERSTIFLDLDGVIVDNRGPLQDAYTRAVSEVLSERLGGDMEEWARAHETFFRDAAPAPEGLTPQEAYRWEDITGALGACRVLGVDPPWDEDGAAEAGHEMNHRARFEYATFFGGAAEAIRALASTRTLHMASGNAAWVVEGTLERVGVRKHLGLMCGADLVGVLKGSDEFYSRLFALAGVRAEDAIVLDDTAEVLALAKAASAATVLVSRDGAGEAAGVDLVVPSLAAFVEVIGA
jgi:phosphoglycolate phosphatase-like HAD superfamily hydrolase